jgi:hypothetical protein
VAAFLIIGVFHPIVIKTEYHIGVKAWPIFLIVGLFSISVSLFISGFMLFGIVSVFGFACLWSIRELYEQVERVEKGWFPANLNCKKNLN